MTLHFSCPINSSDILQAQSSDPFCTDPKILANPAYQHKDGILYRKHTTGNLVPYIPPSLRPQILQQLHDDPISAHMGIAKTLEKAKQTIYFPKMKEEITNYIKTCVPCQQNKYPHDKPRGQMGEKPIPTVWHSLYLDLMGPYSPSGTNRTKYVLVSVDGFSKFVHLQPLRDATADQIADKLERNVFSVFGPPAVIITDNASSFRSGVIDSLCNRWQTRHSLLSPYHPQTNLSERVNRVLKPILRSYLTSILIS